MQSDAAETRDYSHPSTSRSEIGVVLMLMLRAKVLSMMTLDEDDSVTDETSPGLLLMKDDLVTDETPPRKEPIAASAENEAKKTRRIILFSSTNQLDAGIRLPVRSSRPRPEPKRKRMFSTANKMQRKDENDWEAHLAVELFCACAVSLRLSPSCHRSRRLSLPERRRVFARSTA